MQAMERPPQPPGVQAQQGGEFAGAGANMADKAGAGNPLTAGIQAVEKVLMNMAKASPKLGPYVERAMAILKAGVEEAAGKQGGSPEPQGGPPSGPPAGQMPA
jgi:hypothetical protein